MSFIDDLRFKYALSDGLWNFLCTWYLNHYFNALRYHRCDCCFSTIFTRSLPVALICRVLRQLAYCSTCSIALKHTRNCKNGPCALCNVWRDYLVSQENKALATRFVESCGLKHIALFKECNE